MSSREIPKPSDVFGPRIEDIPSRNQPEIPDAQVEDESRSNEQEETPETFRFPRGVVKFVNPDKGFGFCATINPHTGQKQDVYFPLSGHVTYELGHEAHPIEAQYGRDNPKPAAPIPQKGDEIALGSIEYPYAGSQSRSGKPLNPKARSWTTSLHAEELEQRLHERARYYPVGLYYYPSRHTFYNANTYIMKVDTNEKDNIAYHEAPNKNIVLFVKEPGEFPHREEYRYDDDSLIYGPFRSGFMQTDPEVLEGAQDLLPIVLQEAQQHRGRCAELETIAQDVTNGRLRYRVRGEQFELSVGAREVMGQVLTIPNKAIRCTQVVLRGINEKTGSERGGQLANLSLDVLGKAIEEVRQRDTNANLTHTTYQGHNKMVESIIDEIQKKLVKIRQEGEHLEKLIESCERSDSSQRYGLVYYRSEHYPADEQHVGEVIQWHLATAEAIQNQIAILERYLGVANEIKIDKDSITAVATRIPIVNESVIAHGAWYQAGESDDEMYTLATQAMGGDGRRGGPADINGVQQSKFCQTVDTSEQFAAQLIYDVLVQHFNATPKVTEHTQEIVRQACRVAIDEAIASQRAKLSEVEEKIRAIEELVSGDVALETMYELEAAFNRKWAERTHRSVGKVAVRST